jgi:N-succinyldiaminopimelate aminotransferase
MADHALRLEGIGSTIFAEMSALAVRTGAVNLGQGFPDEDGPVEVLEAAVAHQARHYGLDLERRQVVATTGATEAIAGALLGLVDPGDEVVVLEPYYDSYVAMIQMAGAVRRPVTLRAPSFRLDLDELAAAITARTRLILLNSPHNPTGAVLTRAELDGVAALAIEHDLVVVTDEVYEHLTFGQPHIPLATLPGMAERTLTISSAGKSFSVTGWKIGWASGPADLVAAVEGAKNWLSYSSGAPLQPAVAVALNEHDDFHRALAVDLRTRRDTLCSGLQDLGMTVYQPDGTYFATSDVSTYGYADGRAFCLALPEIAGVVAIPSQVFYDNLDEGRHLVRWAFCKKPEVISEGLARLAAVDLHAR